MVRFIFRYRWPNNLLIVVPPGRSGRFLRWQRWCFLVRWCNVPRLLPQSTRCNYCCSEPCCIKCDQNSLGNISNTITHHGKGNKNGKTMKWTSWSESVVCFRESRLSSPEGGASQKLVKRDNHKISKVTFPKLRKHENQENTEINNFSWIKSNLIL